MADRTTETEAVTFIADDSSDDDQAMVLPILGNEISEVQVQKVLAVCPDFKTKDIEKDLKVSGSATATINRIFEGQFLSGTEKEPFYTAHIKDTKTSLSSSMYKSSTPAVAVAKSCGLSMASKIPVEELSDTDLDTDTDDEDIVLMKEKREAVFTSLKDRILCKKKDGTSTVKKIDLTDDNISIPDDNELDEVKVAATSICVSDSGSDSDSDLPAFLYHGQEHIKENKNIEIAITKDINLPSNNKTSFSDNEKHKVGVSTCSIGVTVGSVQHGSVGKQNCFKTSDLNFDSEDETLPLSSTAAQWMSRATVTHPKRSYSTSQNTGDEFGDQNSLADYQDKTLVAAPTKKKTRKTAEENARDKEKAQAKKAAKEREKEAKQLEKEEKRKAALAKKMTKEKEKLMKKADSMTHKSQKRDECLKHIVAVIDPGLLEDIQEPAEVHEVIRRLDALGVQYRVQPQITQNAVTWQRVEVKHTVDSDLQITMEKTYSDENQVLIRLNLSNFVEMVHAFCAGRLGACESGTGETLLSFAKRLKRLHENKLITFIVLGTEKYFRDQKTNQQRQFRNAAVGSSSSEAEFGTEKARQKRSKKKAGPSVVISRLDMEEALVDLQLRTGCTVRMHETVQQLAEVIAMFTKGIAEAPFKRKVQPEGLTFCVEGGDKSSVKVSKDGQGLLKVWQQQIQQFRNVSAEMAAAIVAEYPSPQCLLQAYKRCSSTSEASKLLADILVRRGAGVLATTRRIGPDLSRRVHLLLTSEEGNTSMQR